MLANIVAILINLLALGAVGALSYYRLKDWRTLSGLAKMRRVRDVVFGAFLIFMVSSIASLVVRSLLHGA